MTLQMRNLDYNDGTEWCDLEPGQHYFSGRYQIREKPEFVPGWYYRRVSDFGYTLIYCTHCEPPYFPGEWTRVEEGDLDDLLGFNPDK